MYGKWQPTPVLLPGKSCGRRSLGGCSPWGRKELYTTSLSLSFFTCMGRWKTLGSLKSFLWYTPWLSRVSILLVSTLNPSLLHSWEQLLWLRAWGPWHFFVYWYVMGHFLIYIFTIRALVKTSVTSWGEAVHLSANVPKEKQGSSCAPYRYSLIHPDFSGKIKIQMLNKRSVEFGGYLREGGRWGSSWSNSLMNSVTC